MIHPSTELRLVNPTIGYGVFATDFIPRGTVLYVQDVLEVKVSPEDYLHMQADSRAVLDKYSFVDPAGVRVLSWDFAKYVNHRCECNSMSTGWGFEIALQDIEKGEEITDEYGLFNMDYDMPVACGCVRCRKVVRRDDLDFYAGEWDQRVLHAMQHFQAVEQPLIPFLPREVMESVRSFLRGDSPYPSVRSLKYETSSVRGGVAV